VAPPLVTVEPLENGAVRVVRLSGELDLDSSREIGERLLELVPDHAEGLVADLSDLRYVDSAGVRLFVELSERLERNRQKLVLVVPEGAAISRVLSLVKLDLLVAVHASTAEAIGAIAPVTDQ
jgi:anti-sigma B factor antagonist